ncbi:hypothetical protein IJ579_04440 [bacterium]|nr:hypothetical protein [bacterium]
MNRHYCEKESFKKRKLGLLSLFLSILFAGLIVCGCGNNAQDEVVTPDSSEGQIENQAPDVSKNEAKVDENSEISVDTDSRATDMVSYDITSIGRSDPFMPIGEISAYNDAKNSAYAEANAYNSRIAELQRLKGSVIRERDDISPYSFNLPVPPTSLAPEGAAAAKITRTKVVGIMYNEASPSAIINIDDKDYLVRTGDKIIGQEYKVMKINPNWITVSMGSNVYSAAIGELFSKEDLDKSQNDLYNLKNRFGGRKG